MGTWAIKKTPSDSAVTFASILGVSVLSAIGVGSPNREHIATPYAQGDGAFYQRTKILPRTFTLICGIPTDTRIELHTVRDTLQGYLERDRAPDDTQPCVVQYTENGNTTEIECYFSTGMGVTKLVGHAETNLPLEFFATKPFWRSATELTPTLTFGTGSTSNTVVTGGKNAKTWPQIEITGPGQIFELTNSTTGHTLSLNVVLASGEVVTFDFAPDQKTASLQN